MVWHAYFNPRGISGMGVVNTPDWRSAAIPSTNGHGTARAVATLYSAFLRGGAAGSRWAGEGLRGEATAIQADGDDRVTGAHRASGSGSSSPSPRARSARARARSGTSATADRSALPTPMPGSRSAI